jgi:hypothetical protein
MNTTTIIKTIAHQSDRGQDLKIQTINTYSGAQKISGIFRVLNHGKGQDFITLDEAGKFYSDSRVKS